MISGHNHGLLNYSTILPDPSNRNPEILLMKTAFCGTIKRVKHRFLKPGKSGTGF
jgi:hypothetical protein